MRNFGNIYKRKNSPFWWMWYRDATGKRIPESTKTEDKTLAMKILRSRIVEFSQLRAGKEVSDMPYDAFGEAYLKHCEARFTDETMKSYNTTYRVFKDYMFENGLTKVSDIDKALIDRFIDDRAIKHKNMANTCNNYLKNLHAQGEYAKTQKLIKDNWLPSKYEKIEVTDAEEPKSLTAVEYKKIMMELKDKEPFYYPIFYVYFHTGLRFTELIQQEWKDTSLSDGYMRVTCPKGKKYKNADGVGLDNTAIEMIKKLEGRHPKLVFVDEKKKPFSMRTRKFIRRLQGVAKELGIKDVNLHTTRHTYGSHLIDMGASLVDVQRALRHRDIRTTQAYIHKVRHEKSPYIDKLERKLSI